MPGREQGRDAARRGARTPARETAPAVPDRAAAASADQPPGEPSRMEPSRPATRAARVRAPGGCFRPPAQAGRCGRRVSIRICLADAGFVLICTGRGRVRIYDQGRDQGQPVARPADRVLAASQARRILAARARRRRRSRPRSRHHRARPEPPEQISIGHATGASRQVSRGEFLAARPGPIAACSLGGGQCGGSTPGADGASPSVTAPAAYRASESCGREPGGHKPRRGQSPRARRPRARDETTCRSGSGEVRDSAGRRLRRGDGPPSRSAAEPSAASPAPPSPAAASPAPASPAPASPAPASPAASEPGPRRGGQGGG